MALITIVTIILSQFYTYITISFIISIIFKETLHFLGLSMIDTFNILYVIIRACAHVHECTFDWQIRLKKQCTSSGHTGPNIASNVCPYVKTVIV